MSVDFSKIRIGHGFDVHAFCQGNSIILGGVEIAFKRGLKAHSDGDVVIHALCDALLGAAGLGDIGRHFPDDDASYKNINSRHLLSRVVELIATQGWQAVNIDISVIAQVPKLATFIDSMRANLADDLGLVVNNINIKATTTEGLGYIGREEGIAVHAVCLLQLVDAK